MNIFGFIMLLVLLVLGVYSRKSFSAFVELLKADYRSIWEDNYKVEPFDEFNPKRIRLYLLAGIGHFKFDETAHDIMRQYKKVRLIFALQLLCLLVFLVVSFGQNV